MRVKFLCAGNSLKMKQAILSNPKSFLARKITHKVYSIATKICV